MSALANRSAAELRLDLAEAEYERAKSWAGSWRRKNLIDAITAELVRRGSF